MGMLRALPQISKVSRWDAGVSYVPCESWVLHKRPVGVVQVRSVRSPRAAWLFKNEEITQWLCTLSYVRPTVTCVSPVQPVRASLRHGQWRTSRRTLLTASGALGHLTTSSSVCHKCVQLALTFKILHDTVELYNCMSELHARDTWSQPQKMRPLLSIVLHGPSGENPKTVAVKWKWQIGCFLFCYLFVHHKLSSAL